MHAKSDNIEIMDDNETNEIVQERFDSLLKNMKTVQKNQ